MKRVLVLVMLAPVCSLAQIGGPGTYPQFRSMSGLPGSGYGVAPSGSISSLGAWSISTPIAYSLKPWQLSIGFGTMSSTLTPKFLDTTRSESTSNGTAQFTVGLPLGGYGQGTYTVMILSGRGDNVGNFTWTPPGQRGPITFAGGIQDVSGSGGTQGEGPGGIDPGNSRSYFVVGTYAWANNTYASVGIGSQRFNKLFGNISTNISERTKAVLEYDSFNWNIGVGYDLGKLGVKGREEFEPGASLFMGVIRGKYAYWSLNFRF